MLTKDEILTMKPGRELDEKIKTCTYCNKRFSKKKHEGYRDWNGRKYCSILCKNRHFNETKGHNPKNWLEVVCKECGKKFEARKIYVDRGQYSYCSEKCSYIASRKHEVKEFNSKKYYYHEPSGYFVTNDGCRLNRDVWKFYNGPIPEGHVIHHKDEKKTNDDILNLEPIEWGEHTAIHHRKGGEIGINQGNDFTGEARKNN